MQLTHPDEGRRAALVYQDQLHLLATYRSVYSFAQSALATGWALRDLLSTDLSGIVLDYGEVYRLETAWRFAPCFDHPAEPGRCLVSMAGQSSSERSSSERFSPGRSSIHSLWKYLGSAASLRGHGESLPGPGMPDLAAIYVIGPDGLPRRVGIAQGHRGRVSALGPELVLDASIAQIKGRAVCGARAQEWLANVPLLLALASIEPDHFEAADFRRPGDVHVHFFGERLFTGVTQIEASEGDRVEIAFEGLGRELSNTVRHEERARWVAAMPL